MREKLIRTAQFLFLWLPFVMSCVVLLLGLTPKQAFFECLQFVGGMLTYMWIWEKK